MNMQRFDLWKSEDQMTTCELQEKFDHMVRHVSPAQYDQITASGALSPDTFIRKRQELYRKLIALQSGVVFSEDPNGMMRHPV